MCRLRLTFTFDVVYGVERGVDVLVPEFLKLASHQVEHALAIALNRIAAFAVAPS